MSFNKVNPLNRAVDKSGGGGGEGAPVPPPAYPGVNFFFPRKIGKHNFFTCE